MRILPSVLEPYRLIGHVFVLAVLVCFLSSVSISQDLDKLSADLANGNLEGKRQALFVLRSRRTEAASRIALASLSDADELVRAAAATSVVWLPQAESVKALLPLLSDRSPFVRRETAYALGEIGSFAATDQLLVVLSTDSDKEVKNASIVALGNIGDHLAAPALASILKKKPNEDNEFERRAAAHALGQIAQFHFTGSTRCLTPHSFLPPKFKEIGPPKNPRIIARYDELQIAIPILKKAIENQREADDTRREAAFALGAMRDASSVAILRSKLSSPDAYLAEICREALIRLGEPE